MKKAIFPVFIASLLLTAALAGAQNTYELKTGKTLTVLNQLPDTLKPYFDEKVLVERYGKFTPAADYRIGIAAQSGAINIMFMIPDFNPEDFKKVFYPRTQYPYMLNVRIPGIYMDQLNYWYNNSYTKMPDDLKRTVNNYTITIQALFSKEDQYLLFTGDKSSRGLMQIAQPIVSQDNQYGQIKIWPSNSSGRSYYNLKQQYLYPLDPPEDKVTGEKNTSYLIFKFFETFPE
jgi:hypothetical protein